MSTNAMQSRSAKVSVRFISADQVKCVLVGEKSISQICADFFANIYGCYAFGPT